MQFGSDNFKQPVKGSFSYNTQVSLVNADMIKGIIFLTIVFFITAVLVGIYVITNTSKDENRSDSMKNFIYKFQVFLSAYSMFLPFLIVFGWLLIGGLPNAVWIVFLILAVIQFIALKVVLKKSRDEARKEAEYDEFGRNKKKSYENLSRKERDAIDLQKTADMERVLNSTVLEKITKKGSDNPEQELETLIGLNPVKDKLKEMVARMQFEQEKMQESTKKKKDKSPDMMLKSMSGRHMIFYGNPGTGKTTVARIITGFLYKYGYIRENKCVEVDGNFLKAGSSTAMKTELIIQRSFDGVLFIDEAYSLMEGLDGSGQEAIATLIKKMEDSRDRFILIMAGYTKEMQEFLKLNSGFESRIKEYFDFPDYDAGQMRQIFEFMAKQQGFSVGEDAWNNYDIRITKERELYSFGNGRTARNILDEAIDKHAYNYVSGNLPPEDEYVIREKDISPDLKRMNF